MKNTTTLKKYLVSGLVMLGAVSLGCSVVQADTTYTYPDTWVNWPGYTSGLGDENGTPKIESMDIIVGDSGILQTVDIYLHDSTSRQAYDSLFINSVNTNTTNNQWDDWDYFVHDGGCSNIAYTEGTVASDGFYTVKNGYEYTTVKDKNRIGNPNGIDANFLTMVNTSFGATQSGYIITYDLAGFGINVSDGFFVAYAPWCDNDVIGGGTMPVPEPATMFLFGTGLIGLAGIGKHQRK